MNLSGKRILVTGASRPGGIGAELVSHLCRAGANVAFHGAPVYDANQAYPDAGASFVPPANAVGLAPSDLSAEGAAEKVVADADAALCGLDGMVLNHAYSTCAPIGEWTAAHIRAHLEVNVVASMLMIQEFTRRLPTGRKGAITLFTSGQYLGPMTKEIAYAVSKDAIICLCRQTAAALADKGIRVNCVNPGPTDTGYLTGEAYAAVARKFPSGRWGMPADASVLVEFLQSDASGWITGQVIASEGGFKRFNED